MLFSLRSVQFTIRLLMKPPWQTRPFIICSSSIISPKVNWAVFDEGPSDGFKIGLSVWGMVRANENPTSKNVHQFFSKRATLKSCKFHPFWIQLKYMKLNWSFDSQKKNTAYFSFFFRHLQLKSRHTQLPSMLFWNANDRVRSKISGAFNTTKSTRWFFVDWINSENTLFFLHIKKKKKNRTKKLGNLVCVFLR